MVVDVLTKFSPASCVLILDRQCTVHCEACAHLPSANTATFSSASNWLFDNPVYLTPHKLSQNIFTYTL